MHTIFLTMLAGEFITAETFKGNGIPERSWPDSASVLFFFNYLSILYIPFLRVAFRTAGCDSS